VIYRKIKEALDGNVGGFFIVAFSEIILTSPSGK